MFGIGGTKEAEADVEVAELRARIAQLERAVFKLVEIETKSDCPHSTRGGMRGFGKSDPLGALDPFVTRHDPMGSGRVVRPGVGSS